MLSSYSGGAGVKNMRSVGKFNIITAFICIQIVGVVVEREEGTICVDRCYFIRIYVKTVIAPKLSAFTIASRFFLEDIRCM